MTVITESGHLMLVKSFTDDLAWKVQRQLVNVYFRSKSLVQQAQALPEGVQRLIEATVQLAQTNARLVDLLEVEIGRRRRKKSQSTVQATLDFSKLVDPQGERLIVHRTGWFMDPVTKRMVFVLPQGSLV